MLHKHQLIFLLFIGFILAACKNDIDKIKEFKNIETSPIETAKNIEYSYSENGQIKVKLWAARFNKYEKPQKFSEISDSLFVKIFNEDGELSSTISARYAKITDNSKILEAYYNVVLTDVIQNKKLETEHLIWNQQTHKVYTDKFVKITTPDKIIFGDGFEADENFTEYFIKKPKGEILIEKDF